MTGPCRHVIFPMIDDDTAGPPVLDYVGVLAGDGLSVQFRLTESQTATLIGEKYRHKITVNDPEIDGLVVLARGWFSVFGDGDEQ